MTTTRLHLSTLHSCILPHLHACSAPPALHTLSSLLQQRATRVLLFTSARLQRSIPLSLYVAAPESETYLHGPCLHVPRSSSHLQRSIPLCIQTSRPPCFHVYIPTAHLQRSIPMPPRLQVRLQSSRVTILPRLHTCSATPEVQSLMLPHCDAPPELHYSIPPCSYTYGVTPELHSPCLHVGTPTAHLHSFMPPHPRVYAPMSCL